MTSFDPSEHTDTGRTLLKNQHKDIVVITLILITTIIFAYLYVNFNIPPFEDAAMLMRYSEHLAQGYGIVWNKGEPPVDGATDFLFMVVIGFLNFCGLPIETAAKGLSVASHFLTIAAIYIGIISLYKSSRIPAIISSLYFAFGPGLFLSAAHFGTPFFALFITLSWIFALRILFIRTSRLNMIAFSVLSLIAGLIRPEGVIMATLMLIALVMMLDRLVSMRLIGYFFGIFIVFGGTYFLWRWNYFGYPLPNPFYKKGGGGIYWGSLHRSILSTVILSYPFIAFFILGFRSEKLGKLTLSLSIPILGSTFMWVLLSDEMNFGSRFQYAILPLVLLSWVPLFANLKQDLQLPKLSDFKPQTRLSVLAMMVFVIGAIFTEEIRRSKKITYFPDGKYDAAIILNKYAHLGYTIVATEAGLLPLYSNWHAIDPWGLNDAWIAHNNGITEQYLDKVKPEIIMWHDYFSPFTQPSPQRADDKWLTMVMKLKSYAEKNNYSLAAVFGDSPYNTHYYYVSSSIPEKDKIISDIRNINYMWYTTGKKSINYALLEYSTNSSGKAQTTQQKISAESNESSNQDYLQKI